MGACRTCGEKAGALKSECDTCKAQREAQERAQRAAEQAERDERERQQLEADRLARQQAAEARQRRLDDFIAAQFASLEAVLDEGLTPYVYQSIHIDAHSNFNGDVIGGAPNLSELTALGLIGWEVIGTVPTTYGEALKNTSTGSTYGTTWGAGVGGLVIGAYVLLRLPVTRQVLSTRRDQLVGLIEGYFPG